MDLDTTEATEEAMEEASTIIMEEESSVDIIITEEASWADTMAADTLEEYITTEAYIAEVSAEGDDLVHVFLTL